MAGTNRHAAGEDRLSENNYYSPVHVRVAAAQATIWRSFDIRTVEDRAFINTIVSPPPKSEIQRKHNRRNNLNIQIPNHIPKLSKLSAQEQGQAKHLQFSCARDTHSPSQMETRLDRRLIRTRISKLGTLG